MKTAERNFDGTGFVEVQIFDMPAATPHEFWPSVTDVPCPVCKDGTIRWAEAGYVPGYRICDKCGQHFLAEGVPEKPTLVLLTGRRESGED